MNFISFSLVILGVTLNTVAQLCLKQGMTNIGSVPLEVIGIFDLILKAAITPFILLGLVCYITSFVVWLLVLSRVEVSTAYPMLSVGYVVTAIFGYYFWGEDLGVYKVIGILLICAGVGAMFKS